RSLARAATLDRRRVIALAAPAVLAPLLGGRAAAAPNSSSAERWPSRFVRLLVPFPPGGGTDAIARVVAAKLSDIWGQQMVVENRGGGSRTLAPRRSCAQTPTATRCCCNRCRSR